MKTKFSITNDVLLLSACLFVFMLASCRFGSSANVTSQELPLLELTDESTEIPAYQYLGSWRLPDDDDNTGKGRFSWRDVVRLNFDANRENFKIDTSLDRLDGTERRQLTPDTEAGVFEKIAWQNSQVSVFAFRADSPRGQTAVMEIATDQSIAVYVNGQFVRELSAADNVELDGDLLIPVRLEQGENIFTVKIWTTRSPPLLRMSLIMDRSKDFQAAWNRSWGFLNRLICKRTGNTFEPPAVQWDSLLNRMSIGIEVCDPLSGKTVIKKENVKNGNVIRVGGKTFDEGLYKIIYKSDQSRQETFEEYFLAGSPKNALGIITEEIDALSWSADEKLNLEAQLRRAEILFRKENYDAQNKQWQEKVLYTLGSLAEFVNLKKKAAGDIFKDLPGLQFRGFISKIDNSRQFYRLFIPLNYKASEELPLLLIMPTTIQEKARPFLESPFAASHREAEQVCKFAEKFGFAVLWPGYRNYPAGWTCESVHAEEALEDVEANYAIDSSKISLYGACSGSIYAGRLATIYPNRYAAIVYDQGLFANDTLDMRGISNSRREWLNAISPVERILGNSNIKILVLHNGSSNEGHGIIEYTRKFLDIALPKRPDIKYILGQHKMGVGLWDLVFEFLGGCENKHPDRIKVDIPAASGYAGPISEVFATPFIVVEGTRTKPGETAFVEAAIDNLKTQHHDLFYDAEFVLRKDTEITDEDIAKYSLVLIGNAESNAIWGRLAAKFGGSITPYAPPGDGSSSPAKDAFAEVFKNPANKEIYLLLIGADKLENMALLKTFNPFKAWFDSYVFKYGDGNEREYITAHRP